MGPWARLEWPGGRCRIERPGRLTARRVVNRLQSTPAFHLADQILSSGTNFLAMVVVARTGTPAQFGVFSLFLITYFVLTGFLRSVPHFIAMTMEWDDDQARSGYFFLPPLGLGLVATLVLVPTFALLDGQWLALPLLLLPLLMQDAARMHAFALHKPHLALLSDTVWLVFQCVGFLLAATASDAATAWALGGVAALIVTRPWRIRIRLQRRPVRANVISAGLEYATITGVGFLMPLLASPIITVVGVGALQGANVIRGPMFLLIQGLLFHRMAGPPITPGTCVREALHLSGTILLATLACVPPLLFLRGVYGPVLLGDTWLQVEPLVLPALLVQVLASLGFGPATAARKMGRFALSAKVQGSLAPVFVLLPLSGAALAGTRGFLYAMAVAYAVFSSAWWIVLPRIAADKIDEADEAGAEGVEGARS